MALNPSLAPFIGNLLKGLVPSWNDLVLGRPHGFEPNACMCKYVLHLFYSVRV